MTEQDLEASCSAQSLPGITFWHMTLDTRGTTNIETPVTTEFEPSIRLNYGIGSPPDELKQAFHNFQGLTAHLAFIFKDCCRY